MIDDIIIIVIIIITIIIINIIIIMNDNSYSSRLGRFQNTREHNHTVTIKQKIQKTKSLLARSVWPN